MRDELADIPDILEKLAAFAPTDLERFRVFAERTLATTDLALKPDGIDDAWWLCSAPPDAHAHAFADVAEAVQGRTP